MFSIFKRSESDSKLSELREANEDYAESIYDLRRKLADAERETAQVREALPLLPDVDNLISTLDLRLSKTGGAAFVTRDEIDLLRKALPRGRSAR